MDSIKLTSFVSALSKKEPSADIISLIDNLINSPPSFNIPVIIKITTKILIGLGTFFLLSHLIRGKNNRAMNIDNTRGINIKESVFNK